MLNFVFISRLKDLNLGCVKVNWTKSDLCRIIHALPRGLLNFNFSGFRHILTDTREFLKVDIWNLIYNQTI